MADLFRSFAVYDVEGAPLLSATPAFATYSSTAGIPLTPPSITPLGGALFGFTVPPAEASAGVAYLIGTGGYPGYYAGAAGRGAVAFGVYNLETGAPATAATPVFTQYASTAGAPLDEPPITHLGGGLYAFVPALEDLDAGGVVWSVSTGQLPGSISGVAGAEEGRQPPSVAVTPAANTPIGASTPIAVDVTDPTDSRRSVIIVARLSSPPASEVVWDGAAFGPKYGRNSFTSGITNGVRYQVLREGGWTSAPELEVIAMQEGA